MTASKGALAAICAIAAFLRVQASRSPEPRTNPALAVGAPKSVVSRDLLTAGRPLSVENGELAISVTGEDFRFVHLVDHSELTFGPSQFFIGVVEGHPMSEVELLFTESGLTGTIKLKNRYIQLLAIDGDKVQLLEADPSKMRAADPRGELQLDAGNRKDADGAGVEIGPVLRVENDHLIDLVVFFTDKLQNELNGETAVMNFVSLMEGDINAGFMKTGLKTRVRVVKTTHTEYDEDTHLTWDERLDAFTETDDGFMDEIHSVREEYGGDACMLIIAPGPSDYSGIGWVGGRPDLAFSVSDTSAAMQTAAHELGHNLGCWHDRIQTPRNTGQFDWARGYVNESEQTYTIMAYPCAGCTPTHVFSRPEPYSGIILGNEENNCARRIEERTPIMSAYFPMKVPLGPPNTIPTTPPPVTTAPPPPTTKPPSPTTCTKDKNNCCMGPSTFGNNKINMIVINRKSVRVSVYLVTPGNVENRIAVVAPRKRKRITRPAGTVFRLKIGNRRRCLRSFKLNRSLRVSLRG